MSIDPRRLLGLAFASADLLLEVENGRVILALGAAQRIMGQDERTLMGRAWRDLFTAADRPLIDAVTGVMSDGLRRGPVTIRMAGEPARYVNLTMRALPDNGGRISVSVTPGTAPSGDMDAMGLRSRESFEDIARGLFEAARVTGLELELAMVDFSGLDSVRQQLSKPEAHALDLKLAGAVRAESHAGAMATQLSSERFALVRAKAENPDEMAQRLTRTTAMQATAHVVPIDGGVAPSRGLKALRYALDDFLREGLKDTPPLSLSEAMNRSVKRTLSRAGALGVAVSQRRFTLAYQPVVDLRTGLAHHHEALVRFEDGGSPFQLIRMAEEFDLIEELDHAIADMAVKRLASDRTGAIKLAVNVSGRTIVSETFVNHIAGLLTKHAAAKGRLIFEITETSAIDDLPRANLHIQGLRGLGSLVCLDDFGAGASSFAYLQELSLDIVKIDGRYVRELAGNGRDGAMVRRLVELCRDLKIRTVAEMVETAEVEEVVRKAGVDFAQGWLFGKPADQPQPALKLAPVTPAARRAGVSEGWG
ncbi:sensor domain-containing phosphodiesterase [Caulobacter soli]|uniref:sensor domain-containing phosphodiesterase n=1 Tax=Caulobacter soli TaxID=2708539 RepID=UPI00196A4EFA|nr:EAL domain-containing protein [Caulobacter soli]